MNRFIRGLLSAASLFVIGVASAFALDVNKASLEDLQTIKGVGPVIAERIVTERRKGAFKNDDDLKARVPGVGDVVAGNIRQGTVKASADKAAAGKAKSAGNVREQARGKVTEVKDKPAKSDKPAKLAKAVKDAKAGSK
ncbi:MAG: helix-hairpin-helix domain-containing protein [Burkholderiaceae bacterium]